jgi:hypothetical protein
MKATIEDVPLEGTDELPDGVPMACRADVRIVSPINTPENTRIDITVMNRRGHYAGKVMVFLGQEEGGRLVVYVKPLGIGAKESDTQIIYQPLIMQ